MRTQKSHRDPTSANRSIINRNRLVIGAAVVVMLAAVGLVLASSQRTEPFVPSVIGAPHAEIATTVIDHGDVHLQDFAESVFHIRNTGDQPLHILGEPRVELVQGCCPPRAMVSRMTVQPGEETTITLRYTMHGMMAGQHEFRVYVATDDATQPSIILTSLSNWIE